MAASHTFDDDTEFLFESLKGIKVTFEDGTSTTMDQEMRKAFATAELEYAAEKLIAAAENPKKKKKGKGKERKKVKKITKSKKFLVKCYHKLITI